MSQLFMPFDSETGGFNQETSDLLTVYASIMDEDYKILDELYLKLKPNDGRFPVAEAQALKVNKIDIRQHMEDPETVDYDTGRAQIIAMVKRHLKRNGRYSNISPFGYNVPFDKRWLQKHLIPQDEWESLLHYKDADVMAAVDFLKRMGWFPKDLGSLESVNDYFGLPKRAAHNAKEDTLMTIEVDKKLREIMKSKKDGGQAQDLISLLEAE